jgi:hypothetical protein
MPSLHRWWLANAAASAILVYLVFSGQVDNRPTATVIGLLIAVTGSGLILLIRCQRCGWFLWRPEPKYASHPMHLFVLPKRHCRKCKADLLVF